MSEYPNQPPAPGGWPAQPPVQSAGRATARRARGRGRRGIRLLIAFLALAVALVAADFGAKAYAENMIAAKIDSSGLGVKPSVSIEGWPFLTQIAARDVRAIDISASDVKTGKVVISSITAKATGVHLNSSFNGATIEKINGTAVISFASLENLLGLNSVATLRPDPAAGPDAVKLNAGIIGSVTGKITQTGSNQITLQLTSLSGLASLLGGALPAQSTTIDIPKLPAGLIVRSVTVTSQGIVATASASNTTFSQ